MNEKICETVILAIIYLLLVWKAVVYGGSNMSTVNNVISNVIAIIWATIALSEWILAEKKEDKIYAAVMMILAIVVRR